jgi:hypothetical protein
MALMTTRTSLCFCGWLLNVLARLHPVELEICVYFRVAVVLQAMYATREAGNDIYGIPVITLVCHFLFCSKTKSLLRYDGLTFFRIFMSFVFWKVHAPCLAQCAPSSCSKRTSSVEYRIKSMELRQKAF